MAAPRDDRGRPDPVDVRRRRASRPPLRALAEARGWKAGDLFMALRVAVTGRTATPPLFDTLVALGRDRVLARLDRALEALPAS